MKFYKLFYQDRLENKSTIKYSRLIKHLILTSVAHVLNYQFEKVALELYSLQIPIA